MPENRTALHPLIPDALYSEDELKEIKAKAAAYKKAMQTACWRSTAKRKPAWR